METYRKYSSLVTLTTSLVLATALFGCGGSGTATTATTATAVPVTTPTTDTSSSSSSGGGGGGGDVTAPTATATTETIANTANTNVQSTEVGTAYLVNTSVAVANLASITGAANASWNQVAIAVANTPTALAAAGLDSGTYKVYAVDLAGNLSTASAGIVTIPFVLTAGLDTLTGGPGDDIFDSTYLQAGTGTFNTTDILNGAGGTDTLNIVPNGVEAITPADAYWTNITNFEKIVIATSGAGVQTITTGALFNAAFVVPGIILSTTSAAGAINITMNAVDFTGTTTITAVSTDGAHTIVTGSGAATANLTSGAGAITVNGVGLTAVTASTTGAGAQTIGDGVGGGIALTTVTASSFSGAQTITSTSPAAVTVNATKTGVAGDQTIVTGTGNDIINILGTNAGLVSITANTGADTITLRAGHTSVNTIAQAAGDSKISTANTTTGVIAIGQTITFGTSLDNITNFIGGTDVLNVGTGGAAVTGIGLNEAAFTATKTIFFSGTYAGTTFTIAADGTGPDTLLLDTTAGADQNIATATSWILLKGTNSATLIAGSFI